MKLRELNITSFIQLIVYALLAGPKTEQFYRVFGDD